MNTRVLAAGAFSNLFALLLLSRCASAPSAAPSPIPTPILSASTAAAVSTAPIPTLFPPSERQNLTEKIHGIDVPDPYRWLEDGSSERVRQWTDAQNAYTRTVLGSIPSRSSLQVSIEKWVAIGRVDAPLPRKLANGQWRYFYLRREAGKNQPDLVYRDKLDGPDHVIVNVNQRATDGTTSIDWFFPSLDGRRIAFGTSSNGDEESTLSLIEIGHDSSVHTLSDSIARTKHCSLTWLPNSSGFYYTRYPKKGEVPDSELRYHRRVYLHIIGKNPEQDEKVFDDLRDMTFSPGVDLSPDGRWLLLQVHQGWAKSELYLRDLRNLKGSFVPVAVGKDANFDATFARDRLLVLTNENAPRGRVFQVDPVHPDQKSWVEIIKEGPDTLSTIDWVGGELVGTYLHDASTRLIRFSAQGQQQGEIALPMLGSAFVRGAWNGPEIFVQFSSFAVPQQILRLPITGAGKGTVSTFDRVSAPIDPQSQQVDQKWAVSKDGTRIPYFVIRRKDTPVDGTSAGIVTGYGGFNIAQQPRYLAAGGVFIEHGGVFVMAALRGGGEYGEDWHKAGMFEHKQNVFDDMIAVSESLVREKIVHPNRLAVMGGSNGGLLVGAMITQRPDLFKAALARVPLLDMLRYQNSLIARHWISEYGSSEDPKLFPALLAYSPYHNVHKDTRYPAVLLAAAESDGRVDPMHARKMAAALQYASSSSEPVLLRVESKAGHGVGKPVSKQIEQYVDEYGFMMWKLGLIP